MRSVVPLVAIGLVLVVFSLFLVGRDVTYVRTAAEGEVLALAETGALALQFTPAGEMKAYLDRLTTHPAIAGATVDSSSGTRLTAKRPTAVTQSFVMRFIPVGEPVVGCRAAGGTTLCLEADPAYYQQRLAALLVPHAILLGASILLLIAASVLARGSNRRPIAEITRIVRGAAEESNYSMRAADAKGQMGELARAINTLLEHMHQRDLILRRRTTELENVNREVEAFSYSVSHDLRGPLASIDGFSQALDQDYRNQLDETGQEYLKWIRDGAEQMTNLISGLLQMSRMSRAEIKREPVNLSEMSASIAQSLQQRSPSRTVDFRIEPDLVTDGDERLLHAVLENLMSNAFKFTSKKEDAWVAFGAKAEGGKRVFFVKDNGAGFDSTQAAKMFTAFQRLHTQGEFEGTGIGLATVKRIIERHGGAIWADGQPGQGATFYFTTGEAAAGDRAAVSELTRA